MTTLASDLLDFLMNLFHDADAANEFISDPEAALAQAGLSNVCMDDVDAVMPVVLDYAPVSFGGDNDSSFDRRYDTGGNSSGDVTPGAYTPGTGGGSTTTPGGGGGGNTTNPGGGGGGGNTTNPGGGGGTTNPGNPATGGDDNDHGNAVQQLLHVVNNYSYTSSVDDRDTITDQSVNQNIWADGDVSQMFDNEAYVASGNNAVAANGDAEVDNSVDNSDDHSQDSSTKVNASGSAEVEIGNTTDSNNDNSDNSDRSDNSIEDSFNDDSDNSVETDIDVELEDSFNDNSDNTDVDVEVDDSFNTDNTDNSVETEIDVELENSLNTDNTDNSTEIDVELEDSFNSDNSLNTDVVIEDAFNETSTVIDTDVALENSFNEVDNSIVAEVELENSFNEVVTDNTTVEYTSIDESAIFVDNELDVVVDTDVSVDDSSL